MLVERLDDWDRLSARLGHPAALGLTLDIGHCQCVEDEPVDDCVQRAAAGRLVHVHIEDMRRGIHDHLDFGEGEIDFPPVLGALADVGYRGLVCVELSRHGHAAHVVVPKAIRFLTGVMEQMSAVPEPLRAVLDENAAAWLDEALAAVTEDPAAIRTRFPAV